MILNILKNSKIIKSIFVLLISFLFLSLSSFLFVKTQQTSDFIECDISGLPVCRGLVPPVPVCYNGWVPGKKTDCGPACPYSILGVTQLAVFSFPCHHDSRSNPPPARGGQANQSTQVG
jgi:hypothetical protein